MTEADFIALKTDFRRANVTEKIKLYTKTKDLTREQYRQLLLLFPRDKLAKLEAALKEE